MAWGDQLLTEMRLRGDARAGEPPKKRRAVKRARPLDIALDPANLPWHFAILGAPTSKGNSRAGLGTIPSAAYRRWFSQAIAQVLVLRAGGLRGVAAIQIAVKATFYRARAHRADLDNYLKGLGDFLQRAGFVLNDSLIQSWDGSRLELDRDAPRVVVEITPHQGA
jgi:Holliday junction resolvase RusA-like endonuclease